MKIKKQRKVNIIRALKNELNFYKNHPITPVHVTIDRTELNHLRVCSYFTREEVLQMPKDVVPSLLQHRMVKAFEDSITEFPIETEFDERSLVYKASLDLWVKPKWF